MSWDRLKKALGDEPLPAALVDLDAFDANVERVLSGLNGKRLRVATKSIRCVELTKRALARAGERAIGLMTYTAAETAFLAREKVATDLLLAYPTLLAADVELLATANKEGATASVIADSVEHLEALEAGAAKVGAVIPVVLEVDCGWRPLGLHVGVRRSPLHSGEDVAALAARIGSFAHLKFHGLMGYESQIAGLPDENPFAKWQTPARKVIKDRSKVAIERTRAELSRRLKPTVFNGGGTGSIGTSSAEAALTELTVGSGFLDGHLFDGYHGLTLAPAAYFALQVVRRPGKGLVTCHGGGYIASGEAGRDRLPKPMWPKGLSLLDLEGAGEVQTPLAVPDDCPLRLGDPVFFRHAKSGELSEHFREYVLIRGDRVEGRAATYRGLGHAFLG